MKIAVESDLKQAKVVSQGVDVYTNEMNRLNHLMTEISTVAGINCR